MGELTAKADFDTVEIYYNGVYAGSVSIDREGRNGADLVARGVFVDDPESYGVAWHCSIASSGSESYASPGDFEAETGTAIPSRTASMKGSRMDSTPATPDEIEGQAAELAEWIVGEPDFLGGISQNRSLEDEVDARVEAQWTDERYDADDGDQYSSEESDWTTYDVDDYWETNSDAVKTRTIQLVNEKGGWAQQGELFASRQVRAYDDELECLDDYGEETCSGPVEYHSLGSGNAFPRCEKHWNDRLDRYENSIEQYADSDVAPSWFDPADAGERWDDDY